MNTYHFTITLQGSGDSPEEAWEDAVQAFLEDPGEPHETNLQEIRDAATDERKMSNTQVCENNIVWDPNDPRNW